MDTQNPQSAHVHTEIPSNRPSLWRRIGGASLSTALIFHMLLLLAGAYWVFQIKQPEVEPDFVCGRPDGKQGGREPLVKRDQSARQQSRADLTKEIKRIAADGGISTFVLPDMSGSVSDIPGIFSLAGGDPMSGRGTKTGPGNGPGVDGGDIGPRGSRLGDPAFEMIPQSMRKRCSREDRLQRLREQGGTPGCEDAVVKGLQWLKDHQSPDGSWGGTNKVAMTGLALLSYFGHCENPASEDFGESCLKGVTFLVNHGMANDGKLAGNLSANHWPYEHAIATYALAEAFTFCKELKLDVPSLTEVTAKAGQFIIDNQNKDGGWAYLYAKSAGHTDVSVTGWQIQALRACSHTGIRFPGMNGCISEGLEYIRNRQNDNGGYGYTTKDPAGGLTYCSLSGVGMLCQQMWNKGGGSDLRRAARYVLANTRFDYNSERCDLYAHYYESQAMMRSGGKNWETYNAIFRDQLLRNQDVDGSWKVPGGGHKIEAVAPQWADNTAEGKIYRTCLCTLMLEVYYRFLNTDEPSRARLAF